MGSRPLRDRCTKTAPSGDNGAAGAQRRPVLGGQAALLGVEQPPHHAAPALSEQRPDLKREPVASAGRCAPLRPLPRARRPSRPPLAA